MIHPLYHKQTPIHDPFKPTMMIVGLGLEVHQAELRIIAHSFPPLQKFLDSKISPMATRYINPTPVKKNPLLKKDNPVIQ